MPAASILPVSRQTPLEERISGFLPVRIGTPLPSLVDTPELLQASRAELWDSLEEQEEAESSNIPGQSGTCRTRLTLELHVRH